MAFFRFSCFVALVRIFGAVWRGSGDRSVFVCVCCFGSVGYGVVILLLVVGSWFRYRRVFGRSYGELVIEKRWEKRCVRCVLGWRTF